MLNIEELKKVGNDFELLVFDSISECIEYGDKPKSKGWKGKRESRCNDESFTGSKSWEESKKLATLGWKKGRELVNASLAAIFESGASELQAIENESFAVAGTHPNVPLFLAGEIANMYEAGDDNQNSANIIKLIIDIGASCSIDKKCIANRGAAVAALVDEIESTGKRCEIWTVENAQGSGSKTNVLHSLVCAKQSGEALDIDRVAFVIGHPSMLRRVLFSVLEVSPFADDSGYDVSYGRSIALRPEVIPNDSIYITLMKGNDGYRTPADAMKSIRKIYNNEASAKGLMEVSL